MKILLDFNIKVDRENIFQPKIANKNLHDISNNNKIRVVNFSRTKICQKYNVPTS
jgi:hypothetical protein